MKSKLSVLVLVGLLIACSLPVPPLNQVAAQDDQRGMRVQQGERRVALVIGNSNYGIGRLPNPVNDAADMAVALREMGFDATLRQDLNQRRMTEEILAFGKKLRSGGVGLFYFAGHGIQVGGRNFLVPIGANIEREEDVEFEAVDAGRVLAELAKADNDLNIIILDACRNNPFARSFRSQSQGLAYMSAPSGTIIAYSTAPGSVASDGAGRNGLYTAELLKNIRQPDLRIEDVFKRVRVGVRGKTSGNQVPWESVSLEGDFYFNPKTIAANPPDTVPNKKESAPSALDPAAIELEFWNTVKSSADIEDFREYLKEYPNGRFAGLARNKVRSLEAAAKPPATNPAANPTDSQPAPSGATKQENVELQTYTETAGGAAIEMVRVPGGKFLMGSPVDEKYRISNEGPQHEVTVSSFYMGKYEVTQLQWRAVSVLPRVEIALQSDLATFKGDNLPVETVGWYEAIEFCERLSRATGKSYRLPTEAEWEYACRAGTTGMYAGNLNSMAWYGEDYTKGSTQPVGQKQANRFGLYDMHGNVWEWCNDWYSKNYYEQSPRIDPTGPNSGTYRVGRGGGWSDSAANLRSAYRDKWFTPGLRYNGYLGFRLVRTYNQAL
jgi:formylglycine-generating enzyme required for sulfatase activity